MPHSARPILASAVLVLALPAAAQTFVEDTTKIPSGPPFNNSSTENVDFGDVDLDGDFDVAMADGGDCCNDQNRLWVNQGGAQGGTPGFFADATAVQFPVVLDDSRDVEFVDFDADCDLDLYTSNTSQIVNQSNRWTTNQGGLQGGTAGFYVDETQARWVGLSAPTCSISPGQVLGSGGFVDFSCDSDFADLDDDGDLDLVHSSYGSAFGGQAPSRLFLNDGAGFFTEHNPSGFKLASVNIANGQPALWAEGLQQSNTLNATGANADIASSALDIELGDVDGDWDVDIVHGARQEPPRLFKNRLAETGSAVWRDVTGTGFHAGYASGSGHYEQELGDFDGDDDLDIFGLNWLSGFIDVTLRNDGTGFFGQIATLPSSSSDDNEGDFGDFDNDGDLDLYIANFSGQDRLYRNELVPSGTPVYVLDNAQLPVENKISLDADWGDIDGDGDYDVLVANDASQANELMLNVSQVPDTSAPRAARLEQAPDRVSSTVPTVVRVHVYDNAPYYYTWYATVLLDFRVDTNVWYTLPMRSMGTQIFRGEIPGAMIGTIEYRVRAQDRSGNLGFSPILSFTAADGGCNGAPSTYCTAKANSIPGCVPAFSQNGVPSASAPKGFTIQVTGVPGGNPGLFLYTTNGSAAVPIQNAYGFLCIQAGAGMFRIAPQAGAGTQGVCDGGYAVDFDQYVATQTQDTTLVAGATVDLQCWYRDPPNPGTANFTHALRFTICP